MIAPPKSLSDMRESKKRSWETTRHDLCQGDPFRNMDGQTLHGEKIQCELTYVRRFPENQQGLPKECLPSQ